MPTWTCRPWAELDREAFFDAVVLRQAVFVVEQNCPYPDVDEYDRIAMHLLGRRGAELVAYARLLPPGAKYAEASIGRVVTAAKVRRTGAGRALVAEAIVRSRMAFGDVPIRIGAQRHLERFYRDFGFVAASEPYVEDGIPHVEMLRLPPPPPA